MEAVALGYWAWVKTECRKIKSDGCSKVTQAFKFACEEHDLCYYYAKDPRVAYALYCKGSLDYWVEADDISRAEADSLMAERQREKGLIGWLFSTWRYAGLRIGGWKAWRDHRRREEREAR